MEQEAGGLGAIDPEVPTGTFVHVMDALVRRYVPGEGTLVDAAMRALERDKDLRLVHPGHLSGDMIVVASVDQRTEWAVGVGVGGCSLSVFCPRGKSTPGAVAEAIAVSHGRRLAWVVRTPEDEHEYEVALAEEGADWPAARVRFTVLSEGEIGGGPLWPATPGTPGDRPFFAADLPSKVALCIAEHYLRVARHEQDAASAAVARAMLHDLERRGVGRERMDALRALVADAVGSADG